MKKALEELAIFLGYSCLGFLIIMLGVFVAYMTITTAGDLIAGRGLSGCSPYCEEG